MSRCISTCLVLFLLVASYSAVATAAQILSVSGDMEEVSAPPDVSVGQFESGNVRIFAEGGFQLATNQPVEHQGPGSDPILNPGVIPAGSLVRTYYVHFDPVGTTLDSATGTVTFDRDIRGLILLSGDDGPLEASHAIFGASGTTYPDDGQGFNNFQNEDFNVSADLRTLSVGVFADGGIDAMRVFVDLPEPSSWVLAIMGMAMIARRREVD